VKSSLCSYSLRVDENCRFHRKIYFSYSSQVQSPRPKSYHRGSKNVQVFVKLFEGKWKNCCSLVNRRRLTAGDFFLSESGEENPPPCMDPPPYKGLWGSNGQEPVPYRGGNVWFKTCAIIAYTGGYIWSALQNTTGQTILVFGAYGPHTHTISPLIDPWSGISGGPMGQLWRVAN